MFNTQTEPDPENKLSWSTSGSVKKNLPHLVSAHLPILHDPATKRVLEIASGFGDHILAYAAEAPEVQFQATEYDGYLVQKLDEAVQRAGQSNVRMPMKLDVLSAEDWDRVRTQEQGPYDLITATNLLNVSPWSVTEALFEQIGRTDKPILNRRTGKLAIYCCLKQGGKFMSEADDKFDAELRSRKSDFGIRNLDDVVELAKRNGLTLVDKEAPGGGTNLFLLFDFEDNA